MITWVLQAKDDNGVSFIAAATEDTGEIMVFATPYTFRQRKLAPTDGKITVWRSYVCKFSFNILIHGPLD
jgi:hypothetical protein